MVRVQQWPRILSGNMSGHRRLNNASMQKSYQSMTLNLLQLSLGGSSLKFQPTTSNINILGPSVTTHRQLRGVIKDLAQNQSQHHVSYASSPFANAQDKHPPSYLSTSLEKIIIWPIYAPELSARVLSLKHTLTCLLILTCISLFHRTCVGLSGISPKNTVGA